MLVSNLNEFTKSIGYLIYLEHDVVGEVFSNDQGPGKRAVAFSLAKNINNNIAITDVN